MLRLVVERGRDVAVVGLAVLALDREDRNALIDQRRGDIVLRRQRVAGAEHRVRAAGLERQRQVGGLGRDVRADEHPDALERLLRAKPLANQPENRHLAWPPTRSGGGRPARATGP